MKVTPEYLTVQQVADLLGISKATVWRWVAEGHLPRTIKLGPNVTRLKSSHIEAFIASRMAAE